MNVTVCVEKSDGATQAPVNRQLSHECWCGGWDLNPRTPTGRGPELRVFSTVLTRLSSRAFDLSWQPPLVGSVFDLV
jgi:hypothetical protein